MKCLRLALKSGFRTLSAVAAMVARISLFGLRGPAGRVSPAACRRR
jgi:hypothetical protein